MTDGRPDPDALLQKVCREEAEADHGHLKVFLGYSSHVGKTARMLDEGRRRQGRGQDVVVGWVQVHPEVGERLHELEIVPPRLARNGSLEMDVPAILKRCPQVCLVDELAHNNPPDSRHSTRWEDVKELLAAGIDVVTAVNIQYLEGLKDPIEQLLGVRKPESLPDCVVLEADEVVLVDASPEAIRDRVQQDPTAISTLLPESTLMRLRELAMLFEADAIEQQLDSYRHEHHIEAVWSTQERILVCISSNVRGSILVERGHRVAERLHGELWVVYVTPDAEWSNLTAEERTRVQSTLALARTYHAHVHVEEGRHAADTILAFARQHRITQIFIGHTLFRRFPKLFSQSTVGRIIRNAEGIDVHVVAEKENGREFPAVTIAPRRPRSTERGYLKVYLGYAAGVGKTFQMLADGNQLFRHGEDVVIGYFEPHGRNDTISQIGDLPAMPRRQVEYRSKTFEEMDLPAIQSRRPALVLVDELAHTNVPGVEHEKRWEDVMQLLEAGIKVFTTVNVQHLESLNDTIQTITGVRVRETVPDWVVETADEVVLVDVAARALQNRLRRGVIYPLDKAQDALKNFFREGDLNALRELALRHAAATVEHDLEQRIAPPPQRRESVLACLSTRPSGAILVRRAKRVADYLNADCTVLFVALDPTWKGISQDDRHLVESHLRLAEMLHLNTEIQYSTDVAEAIVQFAHGHAITQIFFGRSLRTGFTEFFSRSLIERVIRKTPDIDVHVVADR